MRSRAHHPAAVHLSTHTNRCACYDLRASWLRYLGLLILSACFEIQSSSSLLPELAVDSLGAAPENGTTIRPDRVSISTRSAPARFAALNVDASVGGRCRRAALGGAACSPIVNPSQIYLKFSASRLN